VPQAARILVLNGPNLNLLGRREPEIYGRDTLATIEAACRRKADELGLAIDFRQTNAEGELLGWIHEGRDTARGIVINPAALTHTSLALLDALKAVELPVVELHLSNPHARESFRQFSYVSLAATGVICGFGVHGYLLALEAIAQLVKANGKVRRRSRAR
jgi:3-dehydroquinate dehydratase-2